MPKNHRFPNRQTPKATGQASINIQSRALEQTHFCLGLKGLSLTDPKRYTASLITTILGGNMSSRLFQQIRENRGLAYSVYSFVTSYMDAGMLGVYAGVHPDRSIETIQLVLNEIMMLKKQPVSTTELDNAKEYTKGNLMLAAESNEHQMFRLAQNENLFGRYIPVQDIVEKIDAVKKEDIIDLAAQLFQTDSVSLTMLGPIQDETAYKNLLTAFA